MFQLSGFYYIIQGPSVLELWLWGPFYYTDYKDPPKPNKAIEDGFGAHDTVLIIRNPTNNKTKTAKQSKETGSPAGLGRR